MKFCFSTLGCHDLTLDEILKLAQKYNVSAIEVRGINGNMSNDQIEDFKTEHVQSTQWKLKSAGVVPLILGTSCKFHDESTVKKNIDKAITEIEIAHRMGFKAIRVFGNLVIEPEEQCIHRVANALDQVCKAAQQKDVQVYLEVHGDFNTVERLKKLMDLMECQENFGLIWDVYHTHSVYGKEWKDFYEAMKEWICHVHIKDAKGKELTLPSKGELEIIPMINHMMNDGYDGWFSLEWERKWFPELPELEIALEYLYQSLNRNRIQIEK